MLNNIRNGLLCALGCLLLAGCTHDKNAGKVTVSGLVKFNGVPVEKGTVTFMPDNDDGDSSSAHIEGGQYSIQTTPGAKKVVIVGYREPKKKKSGIKDETPHGDGSERNETATEQYLPAKFNSMTTLKYAVPEDGGSKNFDLDGKAGGGNSENQTTTQRRE